MNDFGLGDVDEPIHQEKAHQAKEAQASLNRCQNDVKDTQHGCVGRGTNVIDELATGTVSFARSC